jgi:hypothetical protein
VSVITQNRHTAIALASQADDEKVWHGFRAEGATASEIRRIATGGRKTWRALLTDKLNGSTFRGNRHTRRGHEREPVLLEWADGQYGVDANSTLFAHPEHPLHRGTPDGLGAEGAPFGVEVKSHAFGWTRTDAPPEHYDQCQWNIHVMGAERWLYVWEVLGEDGYATLEYPSHVWIERDDARIAVLVTQADAFLAWREAGAPELDDIPDELDESLTAWAEAKERKSVATKDEKVAEKVITAYIAEHPEAEVDGMKRSGSRGGFAYTVKSDAVLDEDAWKAAEPASHAAWVALQKRTDDAAAIALGLYSKTKTSSRLLFKAPDTKAAAA